MAGGLPQQKAAHALRHFTIATSMWGVYGPNAIVTGSVLTGFALSVGVRESQIAFLAAITGLVGLSQILTFYWTRRVANKRRLCVALGVCEITLASFPVIVCPLLAPELRFPVMAALLFAAYCLGHTVSPMFANWMANVIPEGIRATYTGRRMFITTLVSAAYLFAASQWLDIGPGSVRFYVVYGVGWTAGVLGYVLVALTPFPDMVVEPPVGYARSLLEPLRHRPLLVLVLFMGTWTLAMSVGGPFYSVYMLRYLKLSYMSIALYTNIALVAMLLGFRAVGPLAERFGCKPIAKLLIVPAALVPLLWAMAGEPLWPVLIPVACALAGFAVAGIQVAGSALLYKMVPTGRESSVFFAVITGFTAMGAAAGALAGGLLKGALGDTLVVLGPFTLAPPQVVFLVSAGVYLVPVGLVHLLDEPEAETAVGILGKFRGNVLGLAYNYVLFNLARESRTRASALRGMAKSHSPLVVDRLADSLNDVSPEVRHEAAIGLGEAKAKTAVPRLVEHLSDEGSDIRAEAAEALGLIGDPQTIEPLRRALAAPEARLRCSAAIALGEIGGAAARDLLIESLNGDFDRALFPALVDAAGRTGDLRMVEPAMRHLPRFGSPVVRMQIINGVCRALGERSHFYKLFSRHGIERTGLTEPMMKRIVRLFRRAPGLDHERTRELGGLAKAVSDAIADDRLTDMSIHASALAQHVLATCPADGVVGAGAHAVSDYVAHVPPERLGDEAMVFTVVALTSIARHLGRQPLEGAPEDA